jgi:putative intracellular protease/amidase
MARVLIGASNHGVWGEELQAPWDALTRAGHSVTLCTPAGKKPLPLQISVDPSFVDPVQRYHVNPPEVCDRVKELIAGDEWGHAVRFADVSMSDFDAIVMAGGLGAMLDIGNNRALHRLILDAIRADKLVGAVCYAVAALVFARDPAHGHRSVIHGKTVTAHPREWDFVSDSRYDLYQATPDNPGTDLVSPGFLFPLQDLAVDAVGPAGRVTSNPLTSRDRPDVQYDWPFVTGCSVESSIAYGEKLVQVLSRQPAAAP